MPDRRQEVIDKLAAIIRDQYHGDPLRLFDAFASREGAMNGDDLFRALYVAGIGNRFTRGIYVAEIIEAIDTDENATISRDEFLAALGLS